MYLMWSLCTLYLPAYQVSVAVGDSGVVFVHVLRISNANEVPCVLILCCVIVNVYPAACFDLYCKGVV